MLLLGSPEVRRDGQLLAGFRSAKAQALLYYLAVRGQPVMRATLVGLLWADQAEEQARSNLNQTLSNLRKVMGEALESSRQTVALAQEQIQALDVRDLSAAARQAQTLDTTALLTAASLYRGELLEGLLVRDAAEFDIWLQTERERMRDAAITLLVEAARRGAQASDPVAGEQALRLLLRIEPWRESAHRQLMLLLVRSGARDAALSQYAACRAALAAALDVEPDAETERLHAAIRSGEIGPDLQTGVQPGRVSESPPHPAERSSDTRSPAITHAGVKTKPEGPPHNLPSQSTPFVGRARELADVVQCLADPHCRLLTLVGPGGIGKSRLAQQAALHVLHDKALAERFADGIFFVPLAAVDAFSGVLAAVAEAVGLLLYDQTPAEQQIRSFLAHKCMLIVLDNLEQLLSGDEAERVLAWLSDLLAATQKVTLLATTREGVGLQEAWFYPLDGLLLPAQVAEESAWAAMNGMGDPDLPQADAVQLFVQSARRAKVGFSLSTTQDAVARICRLVDGVPLAIELAAAWLKVLTAEQVAAELARSLDILTTRHQNVPLRHRSMRAVYASSWQLLAPPLQAVLRQLALCRGGFGLEAAGQIAGASLFDLATLVEKSLLRQAENGRYEMHELLRQYTVEQVAEHGEMEAMRRRHADYYLNLLQRRGAALTGAAQRQALNELAEEQENLHVAWQWAVGAGEWQRVEKALAALYNFMQVRSSYWEGKELFDLAATALSAPSHPLTPSSLWVRIRARQGAFIFYLGQYDAAVLLVEESLAQARSLALGADEAFALNLLGQIAGWQGAHEQARIYLQESLAICRRLADRAGRANALHKLAQIDGSVGDYAAARLHAQESLDLCRQVGRPDWIGYALDVLGWVTLCLGDYEACTQHYTASLHHFREIGDRLGIALALGGLGSVEWARGGDRLLSAAAYMTESLNLCQAIGHRHHAASRLWYLGQIAVEQEDYWQARDYAEEGRALAQEVGSRVFVAYNLCSLGAAEMGLGNVAQAHAHLLSVLRIASEVAHLPPLLMALIELARLSLHEGGGPPQSRLAQRRLAQESLAAVIAHPACWQPYRVRAQRVIEQLAAAAGGQAAAAQAAAISVEQAVAAWQKLAP